MHAHIPKLCERGCAIFLGRDPFQSKEVSPKSNVAACLAWLARRRRHLWCIKGKDHQTRTGSIGLAQPTATRTKFGRTCDITQAEIQRGGQVRRSGKRRTKPFRQCTCAVCLVCSRLYGEGSHDLCGIGLNSLSLGSCTQRD